MLQIKLNNANQSSQLWGLESKVINYELIIVPIWKVTYYILAKYLTSEQI